MHYCLVILNEEKQKVLEVDGFECRSSAIVCIKKQLAPFMIGIVAQTDLDGNWLSAKIYRNVFGKVKEVKET